MTSDESQRRPIAMALSVCVVAVFIVIGSPRVALAQYPCGANPFDNLSDSAALQSCLNGGGTVALIPNASPGYLIDTPLTITVANTELTSNASGRVILRATSALQGRILNADNVTFTLSHVTLIGRADPSGLHWSKANLPSGYQDCGLYGQNANLTGSSFLLDDVESSYAVCGSGMVVGGSGFEIKNSWFHDNGWPEGSASSSFSDGLTVGACNGGWIHNNTLEENTDIDLVVGGGHNCVVEDNAMNNYSQHAFAGLHVGWFPSGNGDHSGSNFRYNTLSSGSGGMAFGIMVGFEPWWDPSPDNGFVTDAGSVTNNTVSGAVVNLAIDGIGNGYVSGNTLSSNQGTWGYGCTVSMEYSSHFIGGATIDSGLGVSGARARSICRKVNATAVSTT